RARSADYRSGEWSHHHWADRHWLCGGCCGEHQHVLGNALAGDALLPVLVVPSKVVHGDDGVCVHVWLVCWQLDADGAAVLGDAVWPERTSQQRRAAGNWHGFDDGGGTCGGQGILRETRAEWRRVWHCSAALWRHLLCGNGQHLCPAHVCEPAPLDQDI
ncbi:hypothetical protein IWW57_004326, partial [Coemansia sp. S610]